MIPLVNDAVISAFWLYYGSGREEPAKDRIDLPTGFAAFPGSPSPHRVGRAGKKAGRGEHLPALLPKNKVPGAITDSTPLSHLGPTG